MNKKYELTDEKIDHVDRVLYRIRALVAFETVSPGDMGGYIEAESNLSQYDKAWVCDNARVFDKAQVYGNAWIRDNALVYENACVYGDAQVYDNAWICGDSRIYDEAKVYGSARVYGNAQIYGKAQVYDKARVLNRVHVRNNAHVCGNTHVYDSTQVHDNTMTGAMLTLDDHSTAKTLQRIRGWNLRKTGVRSLLEYIRKAWTHPEYDDCLLVPDNIHNEIVEQDGLWLLSTGRVVTNEEIVRALNRLRQIRMVASFSGGQYVFTTTEDAYERFKKAKGLFCVSVMETTSKKME